MAKYSRYDTQNKKASRKKKFSKQDDLKRIKHVDSNSRKKINVRDYHASEE